MSDIGSTFPVPSGKTRTFPRAGGGRLGGVIEIIQGLESAREAYLVRMAEMEKVKAEAATLTKELSEEGCDQCVYTQGLSSPIEIPHAARVFRDVSLHFEQALGEHRKWYLKGYSRKQALQHQVFVDDCTVPDEILSKWEKRYKKNYPFFGEGIWDGRDNDISAGIDLTSSYSSTNRRNNPMSLVIEFSVLLENTKLSSERMLDFMCHLLALNENCTYLNVESGGYGFPEIIPKENGYDEVYKKVFPDRISCGWMLFIPAIILPDLIPEAARVVSVLKGDKQIGTIVVSTEEIFDGNNEEHIGKANDIEIKLLGLGLLPLMTEL